MRKNTQTDSKLQVIAITNQQYNNVSLSKKGQNQLKDRRTYSYSGTSRMNHILEKIMQYTIVPFSSDFNSNSLALQKQKEKKNISRGNLGHQNQEKLYKNPTYKMLSVQQVWYGRFHHIK